MEVGAAIFVLGLQGDFIARVLSLFFSSCEEAWFIRLFRVCDMLLKRKNNDEFSIVIAEHF